MTNGTGAMTRERFVAWMIAIAAIALVLRVLFLTADPPWTTTVGIVWHDEGAWTHNARNKALFGAWRTDAWNPLYIAPVFTGLEYLSFAAFGVGLWQARLVPALAGLASVVLIALGVRRLGGREAGVIAGALLATNYVYVMYNRAALMEGPMVAFMAAAWYAYLRADERPWWGWVAAACALLAFFTKAAAAFFVVAIGVDALLSAIRPASPGNRAAGRTTVVALACCGLAAVALFILPNWTDYRFYNWQMSVTRKPSYDLKSLLDRVTWFPVLHDVFTRMWFVLVVAAAAALGMLARFWRLAAAERLLVLWVGLGALELLLHDVGNERRFVFFIPALVAIAALALGRERRLVAPELATIDRRIALLLVPIAGYALYVVCGSIARLVALYEPRLGVRLGAAAAVLLLAAIAVTWARLPRWLSRGEWSPRAAMLIAALVSAGQLAQFVQWAAARTYKNHQASIELGRRLPPGTLVHGKLANGLALDNRIRPVFVGREFGNYEDRRRRDDVRYILTYVAPRVGYEGSVIQDVLEAYPNRTIIMTFDVAETTSGHDRAALIDKFGGAGLADAADRTARAQD